MLELKRPLVFFDIESTGTDRENDRIIQIALHKLLPDMMSGKVQSVKKYLVNPGMSIPPASTLIHGITDKMVKDCPYFRDIAGDLFVFLAGCDVAGYGSNYFDVPLLFNEFVRCGYTWDPRSFHMIDVGNLFKIKETRTLSAAVKFYCGREMENAHDASADTQATVDVFVAQLERYDDLPITVEQLALYTNYGAKVADLSGKFVYNTEGVLLLNFGKHKGQPASEHLDFVQWMLSKDFAMDTLQICYDLLESLPALGDDDELPW